MAPGSGTTTSTQQMTTFQTNATEAATRIQGMMTTLLNNLAGLESNWIGMGGSSFQQTKSTVEFEVSRLHGALTGIATDVGTASANYVVADDSQSQAMKQVNTTTSGITSSLTPA